MFKRVVFRYNYFIVLFILLSFSKFTLAGQIIYVDKDASNMNTGLSWEGAKKCLQDALAIAQAGDEIHVAKGIYKPDESFINETEPEIISSGDRQASFELKTGVIIKGGYAGFGGPDHDLRDIELYETILSGDLSGNDVELDDPCDLLIEPTRSENSYQIITSSYMNETAVLDGFTITGGNANGSYPYYYGGGMYNYEAYSYPLDMTEKINYPKIINCKFKNNSASTSGGGVYNRINTKPVFINCTFSSNSSRNGGGIYSSICNLELENCTFNNNFVSGDGAGLFFSSGDLILTDCFFNENTAVHDGGAIWSYGFGVDITNCKFIENAAYDGGGIYIAFSYPVLTSCTFSANNAERYGGAMYSLANDMNLLNCLFLSNNAADGSALAFSSTQKSKVTNCILWDDGNEIYKSYHTDLEVLITYSDVKGSYEGIGNIDADPCFASPGYWNMNGTPDDSNDDYWIEGDYHLKSQAGRFDINTQSWILDDVTSPCIDAGDPLTPIKHEPLPNSGIINIGIWGGTDQASKSLYDVNSFPESHDPNPSDGTINVNLDKNLTWNSDANAIAHEIYFGTSQSPSFALKDYKNKFDPGVLLPDMQYYWRVDNIDILAERSIGDTWTFITGPEPNAAYNPIPEDQCNDFLPGSLLSWNSGVGALQHTVYLGTDFNDVNEASPYDSNEIEYSVIQNQNYYIPTGLDYNTTYYWRVDEQDDYNSTRGEVWTFKTIDTTYQAYSPNPASGSIDLENDVILSWAPSTNSVKHNVYLGTNYLQVNNAAIDNPIGALVSIEQEYNFYELDDLYNNTKYYWRIDEIDSNGVVTKGNIWEFTTQRKQEKGRGCFLGQTPVWIDGKMMEISKAVVNQNTSANDRIGQVQVHDETWDLFDVTFDTGYHITVANNHYFLTESDKWMSLHKLEPGMTLKTGKGSVVVTSVKKKSLPFTGKVYNLKIEGSDRYMVGEDAVIVRDY